MKHGFVENSAVENSRQASIVLAYPCLIRVDPWLVSPYSVAHKSNTQTMPSCP